MLPIYLSIESKNIAMTNFKKRFFACFLVGGILTISVTPDYAEVINNDTLSIIRDITIYVSVNGNDSATGFSNVANADDSDGPVKTEITALKKIRYLRALRENNAATAKIVFLKGLHVFTAPLVIGPQDSNLTIEGDLSGKSVLYGGRSITGWQKEANSPFWFAKVNDSEFDFRQFYVNGKMRPRARLPKQGRFKHESIFNKDWMMTSGGGFVPAPTTEERSAMKYAPGQISEETSLSNAEFLVFHSWDASWTRAISHEPVERVLRLNPPCSYPPGAFGIKDYVIENIREGMLKPGQWYLDRDNGKVVYWPLKGEYPVLASFEAPLLSSLIQIIGTNEKKVANINIKNICLDLSSIKLEQSGGFGAPFFDGAVSMTNAVNCSLEALSVTRAGGQGIKASESSDILVKDSEVSQTGANGIYFRGGINNHIINNLVHHVGIIDPNAMGINVGYLKNSHIAHNDVYATSYTGIAIGNGMNDMSPAMNLVEFNRVWNTMNILNDGGCIYLYGKERHTIIRNNVLSESYGSNGSLAGLYLDETVEDVICENNLIKNISGSILHLHLTKHNTICNNIFVCKPGNIISFLRSSDCIFDRNIIYAPNAEIKFLNPEGAIYTGNLFYSSMNKSNIDKIPIAYNVDPKFVDPNNNNFELRSNSPALMKGFKPFDPSKAGRLNNP